MACYLCAYLKTEWPDRLDPLDPSSPARLGEEVGTCWMCSVAACPLHGTRYGKFECAMCTPAVATSDALGVPARVAPADPAGSGDLGSAAAIAARVGASATTEHRDRVSWALMQIDHDRRRPANATPPFAPSEWQGLPPNLVYNYRGAAARWLGESDFVERAPFVSLDAVASVIRETFAGRGDEQVRLGPDDPVQIVTGALLVAVAVADPQPEVAPSSAVVRLPWEMAHPVLLDPLMWLVATAYHFDQ